MPTRKLPFVVQPKNKTELVRLGTEKSGQIEVERRGYLTVGEKALAQEAMRSFESGTAVLYQIVNEIATANDKTAQDVLNDITESPTPEYLNPWIGEIREAMNLIEVASIKRQVVHASAILVSRVDPECEVEDTMKLNKELVTALSDFYLEEDAEAIEDLAENSEDSGAEGKK